MYNSDLQYIILQKLIQILLYERKKAVRNISDSLFLNVAFWENGIGLWKNDTF